MIMTSFFLSFDLSRSLYPFLELQCDTLTAEYLNVSV
jgi:hypothetical protein